MPINFFSIKTFLLVILMGIVLQSKGFAQNSGQIININQNYQIAFTDLGNRVLKQGDVVKVFIGNDDFVYLQVIESSAILTKLGFSKVTGFQTNYNDFQRLAVGNGVYKVSTNQDFVNVPDAPKPLGGSSIENIDNQKKIQQLEAELENAKKRIILLEEKNQQLSVSYNQNNSVKSKETLEQLKLHLENIKKIINDNP